MGSALPGSVEPWRGGPTHYNKAEKKGNPTVGKGKRNTTSSDDTERLNKKSRGGQGKKMGEQL